MTKPITPEEVVQKNKESLPPAILEAFNELIASNWDGHSATVMQPEVVKLIISKMGDEATSEKIFKNHWLDVEPIFKKAGWNVEYDKPGYLDVEFIAATGNEDYEASFKFSKKKKQRSEDDDE